MRITLASSGLPTATERSASHATPCWLVHSMGLPHLGADQAPLLHKDHVTASVQPASTLPTGHCSPLDTDLPAMQLVAGTG